MDARCLPCPQSPGMVWIGEACNFTCAEGYGRAEDGCVLIQPGVPASVYNPGDYIMSSFGVVSAGCLTATLFFGHAFVPRVWKP